MPRDTAGDRRSAMTISSGNGAAPVIPFEGGEPPVTTRGEEHEGLWRRNKEMEKVGGNAERQVNQRGTLDVNTCKGEQEQPISTKECVQTIFRGGDMRQRTQGSSEMNAAPRGYNTRYENRQYGKEQARPQGNHKRQEIEVSEEELRPQTHEKGGQEESKASNQEGTTQARPDLLEA